MAGMGKVEHKKQWFQACMYILNKHWDKVDNFRIDKFLALLRNMFSQVLAFLKETNYDQSHIDWLTGMLEKLFLDNLSAVGICLQITDVFIPELGKIDKDGISLDQIGSLLKPFMKALAQSKSQSLKERIIEHVFDPLLESNVTQPDSDDESDEAETSEEEDLTKVDGGKLSKRSRQKVQALANEKYIFPSFNILIFAENYIFPQASAGVFSESEPNGTLEQNRETIYNLYYKALKLEPEPKYPEPTFSQRQLMNRARKFVTMKMKKRAEMRVAKGSLKDRIRAKKVLSEKVMQQLRAQFERQGLINEDGEIDVEKMGGEGATKKMTLTIGGDQGDQAEEKTETSPKKIKSMEVQQPQADTGNQATEKYTSDESSEVKQKGGQQADAGSTGSDEVLNISATKQKKKKLSKSQRKRAALEREEATGVKRRRVVFKMDKNTTREFHTYSKVATKVLPNSSEPSLVLKSAIKKSRSDKQTQKLKSKHAKFAAK